MRLSGSVEMRCALPSGSSWAASASCQSFRPSALRSSPPFRGAASPLRRPLGFRLQLGLGRANLSSRFCLSATYRASHRHAASVQPVLLGIGRLGGFEPDRPRPEALLPLLHARVAHRLCLDAFALVLVLSSATWPASPARLSGQLQHLHEQSSQLSQLAPAETPADHPPPSS